MDSWLDRTRLFFRDRAEIVIAALFYVMAFFVPISSAVLEVAITLIILLYVGNRACTPLAGSFFSHRRWMRYATPLDRPLLLWVLLCLISIIFSHYQSNGFDALVGKVLPGVLLFFIFVNTMTTSTRLGRMLAVIMVSAGLVFLAGIWQDIFGYDFLRHSWLSENRVSSSLRAPTDFAVYIVSAMPILLIASFHRRHEKKSNPVVLYPPVNPWVARVILIMGLFCLGVTYSRGGWLAFVGVAALMGMLWSRKMMMAALAICVLFIGVFAMLMLQERTHMHWHTLLSSFGRTEYWREAIAIIADYSLYGAGLNSYSKIAPAYKVLWGGYPHNCFLHMAAEIGLIGLAAFLWAVGALYQWGCRVFSGDFRQAMKWGYGPALLIGLAAYLIQSAVDTFFYSTQLGTWFWLYLAMASSVIIFHSVSEDKESS